MFGSKIQPSADQGAEFCTDQLAELGDTAANQKKRTFAVKHRSSVKTIIYGRTHYITFNE